MSLDNVSIVLVRTSHAGNIGAVARAMANMGFSDLRLVEPVNFPAPEATARAVGAAAILESAEVFGSLDEAISDAGLVVGATARLRSVSWPTLTPHEAMQEVAKMCKANKISLVFGKESSGLTNEELDRAQRHVRIPVEDQYPSLNLAAAVLILCYEARRALVENVTSPNEIIDNHPPLATGQQVQSFFSHLESVLKNVGFIQNSSSKLFRKIKRIFSRTPLQEQEVNILRGILTSIENNQNPTINSKD